jgi:hypothetical protein
MEVLLTGYSHKMCAFLSSSQPDEQRSRLSKTNPKTPVKDQSKTPAKAVKTQQDLKQRFALAIAFVNEILTMAAFIVNNVLIWMFQNV